LKVLFTQNIEGIAGSEKYFWQLLPALKSKGVDVEFLCVHKKQFREISQEFSKVLTAKNIPVHFIETSSYLSFRLVLKIRKILKKEQYDILHSHLIYADFWSAFQKKIFRSKIITVSTLHGYQEDIYTQYCLEPKRVPKNKYYKVARFCYSKIDHIYACSFGLKNFFEQIGITTKKPIDVIHHGFDYPPIQVNNKHKEEFRCVIAGRLIPRKGHQFVFNNIKKLSEQIPHFKLVIVGDGPLRIEFEKEITKLKADEYIELTGFKEDARAEMAKADVVLVPSYAEGLPLVIFEAMSIGKPVIAFKTIGPEEVIVTEKTGYLIDPFNGELFCDKIIELYKNRPLLEAMGNYSKTLQETNFSLEKMTQETLLFYQNCLK